jgi:prepilin-type N-terminal cleavage/methylation domain-containing protein
MGKKKKKAMTLLEIMIVIFIIGIISSVVGYNMKGTLDKAKAFKTEEGIKKIKEIFELEMAQGATNLQEILHHPEEVLKHSGLVNKDIFKDGWGRLYQVSLSQRGALIIKSEAFERYKLKHKKPQQEEVAISDVDEEEEE